MTSLPAVPETAATDFVLVSLPRAVVARLAAEHRVIARASRNSARATEKHAPQTKRNAKAIAQWRDEADESDAVAINCDAALKQSSNGAIAYGSVTHAHDDIREKLDATRNRVPDAEPEGREG